VDRPRVTTRGWYHDLRRVELPGLRNGGAEPGPRSRADPALHLMWPWLSSRIMARTTVDIDAAVLRDLKRLQKRQGKSLGQLISELVAAALTREKAAEKETSPFRWKARAMGARIDLEDKEAVRAALESD